MSLSAIPEYLNAYPPDVVFAHVAPQVDGHVSMGTNCDVMFAGLHAAQRARKTLIALINPMMPRTFGHLLLLSMSTHLVDINRQAFGHGRRQRGACGRFPRSSAQPALRSRAWLAASLVRSDCRCR
jgi:hypothetical protein